jgi:hypothetical protein
MSAHPAETVSREDAPTTYHVAFRIDDRSTREWQQYTLAYRFQHHGGAEAARLSALSAARQMHPDAAIRWIATSQPRWTKRGLEWVVVARPEA